MVRPTSARERHDLKSKYGIITLTHMMRRMESDVM